MSDDWTGADELAHQLEQLVKRLRGRCDIDAAGTWCQQHQSPAWRFCSCTTWRDWMEIAEEAYFLGTGDPK